jgi:hypothetical protein
MEIDIKIDATPNEIRRLLGNPDISPMIELLSVMLDQAMMVVVDARLQALESAMLQDEDVDNLEVISEKQPKS